MLIFIILGYCLGLLWIIGGSFRGFGVILCIDFIDIIVFLIVSFLVILCAICAVIAISSLVQHGFSLLFITSFSFAFPVAVIRLILAFLVLFSISMLITSFYSLSWHTYPQPITALYSISTPKYSTAIHLIAFHTPSAAFISPPSIPANFS